MANREPVKAKGCTELIDPSMYYKTDYSTCQRSAYQTPGVVFAKRQLEDKNAATANFGDSEMHYESAYRGEFKNRPMEKRDDKKEQRKHVSQVEFSADKDARHFEVTSHQTHVEPNVKELNSVKYGGTLQSSCAGYDIITGGPAGENNLYELYKPGQSVARNTRLFQPSRIPDHHQLDLITGEVRPTPHATDPADGLQGARAPLDTLIAVRPPM